MTIVHRRYTGALALTAGDPRPCRAPIREAGDASGPWLLF